MEEPVKISWKKAQLFVINTPRVLAQEQEFTKFKFALEKQYKKIKAKVDSLLNEKLTEIEMDYAVTKKVDKKDVFVFEDGRLTFDKESEMKVREAKREFLEDTERGIEITPHYLSWDQVPEYFSLELFEMCSNILFRPFASEEEEEAWYLSRGKDKKQPEPPALTVD